MHRSKLIAVAGPTGAGKSELALRIAGEMGGEIVNCDSVQLYRHFDLGTAKIPPERRRGIPHHLLDLLEPDAVFSAGDYARLAAGVIEQIQARGRVPILVGGTGFYLRALLRGLAPAPPRDEAVRARLERRESLRPGSLHRILRRLDPTTAVRIHPHDRHKLIRALEVRLASGRPLSSWFLEPAHPAAGFETLLLGLNPPRDVLYERINRRCALMFERGLVDEVRRILALGYSSACKPFESLGYRQALAVAEGRMTVEEAVTSTQTETRNYAKRQYTWFRREAGLIWLEGFGETVEWQPWVRGFLTAPASG